MSKSEREPRMSPLAELLVGVGVFVGGWILYGVGRAVPVSFGQSMVALLAYVAVVVGFVVAVIGVVHVVRGRNARQQLTDQAARTIVGGGRANELDRLVALHGAGSLSDAEFDAAKKQLLGL